MGHTASTPFPGPPANDFPKVPLIFRVWTAGLNRVDDWWWERRLGIFTRGFRAVDYTDASRYEATAYVTNRRVLRHLKPGPGDVIADLGSGKGRFVCLAAQWPVREVVGVEIDAGLHAAAGENLRRLRRSRAPIRLLRQSAAAYDFAGVTLLFMFNPFGGATMREVLDRLRQSWETTPRLIRIVYLNAVHTHLLNAQPWLELATTWSPKPWSRLKIPVHFYRTRDRPVPRQDST